MAADDRAALSGFTVASYNVELARRVDGVVAVLAAHEHLGGADVLAVQEADDHIVERIAARFGRHALYHPADRHPATGRNFGLALFSRWPMREEQVLQLPRSGWRPRVQRIAVHALVDTPDGALHVCNVHLSTMLETSPRGQDQQVRTVMEAVRSISDPLVVIGDLNRRGAADLMARAGFDWHTRGVGRTHLIWSFDHVLSRGLAGTWTVGSVREALSASDHRAVWARYAPG